MAIRTYLNKIFRRVFGVGTRFLGWLLLPFFLYADEEDTHHLFNEMQRQPWFTGPIVAPSGYTVKPGHVNIQPFLFINANTGTYNPHWHVESAPNFYNTNFRVQTKVGICDWLDIQCVPQGYYKATQGEHAFAFGDLPMTLNIQLLNSKKEDPWPAIKLGLRVNVPSGKYQKLDPKKLQTDVGGNGNWEPGPVLTMSKLWMLYDIHAIEARLST